MPIMNKLRAIFQRNSNQNTHLKTPRYKIPIPIYNEGGGRPFIFTEEDKERVWKILNETKNMSETARQLGCSVSTIKRFKKKYPELTKLIHKRMNKFRINIKPPN